MNSLINNVNLNHNFSSKASYITYVYSLLCLVRGDWLLRRKADGCKINSETVKCKINWEIALKAREKSVGGEREEHKGLVLSTSDIASSLSKHPPRVHWAHCKLFPWFDGINKRWYEIGGHLSLTLCADEIHNKLEYLFQCWNCFWRLKHNGSHWRNCITGKLNLA